MGISTIFKAFAKPKGNFVIFQVDMKRNRESLVLFRLVSDAFSLPDRAFLRLQMLVHALFSCYS